MKQACYHPLRASRGIALIGCILAAVIVTNGFAGCGKKPAASPDTTQTTPVDRTEAGTAAGQITSDPAQSLPGRAMQKALGTKCMENIRQVRMMVESAKSETEEGTYPADLTSVQGVAQINRCPLGRVPYTYEATTGKVSCPHPGHDKF
jgi:hypothetical protein